MRIGAKKRPFYRIVAVDERNKRTGGYLELLGTYNPLTQPKEIKLEQDKIDAWIKKGAQMSDGFLRIIGKAAQKPPRKPKKAQPEKKEASTPAPESSEEVKETATEAEETPVEESAPQVEEKPTEEVAETAAEEAVAVETETTDVSEEAPATEEVKTEE